ncbi:MAG: ABC transporter permease [Oscillospiraceae bacterium]
MFKFILKRVVQLIPILFIVSILIFGMVRLSPSDPVSSMTKGKQITAETRQAIEEKYHLNESYPKQYLIWITSAIKGDLGDSFQFKQSVNSLVSERIGVTVQLVAMSSVLALLLAIPIGIFSAIKMNTFADSFLSVLTLIFVSSPVFLTGIIFLLLFALKFPIFPSFGTGSGFMENLYYLALPALALALNMVALTSRITRSNMIEQLNSNYAQTAIAKGVPGRAVIFKHTLKNALIPIITVTSIQIGSMLVGAVMVENVFALGGLGALLIGGIKASDYPLVQGITLMLVVTFMVINLIVDITYALIDPRIRLQD